ncbi:MAG TPA: DUF1841 family protein [Chromatiales bacterium]|nr:DUF1841 family protein [Thiotrichales bacterium]HIP69576.1 DUF1841 family protein [Chromatiales bacterium]
MFAQSREETRQLFCSVFKKVQEQTTLDPLEQQIAEVIKLHPEYHKLLMDPESALAQEFTPEQGQSNPFLHMGMHLAIREQVSTDRPAGIREYFSQLIKKLGESETEHRMMECLGNSLWEAQRNNSLPDEQAYLDCIHRLL